MAIGVAVNVVAAHNQAKRRAAPCRPAHPTYGKPPGGASYVAAAGAMRRRTLRALHLDRRADLQLVQRDGVTYGEVVGVPTGDPQAYLARLVRQGHAKAGPGYSLISYGKHDVVAVGARGCRAIYVAAATPDDVRLLAAAVFSG